MLSVTRGHPAAIAGAAAFPAAVALVACGDGPLDGQWMTDIADDYRQGSVYGAIAADGNRGLTLPLGAGLLWESDGRFWSRLGNRAIFARLQD